MIRRGIATFTLDTGKCPRWLFERMVKLGNQVIEIIVDEYGPDEFIARISDPVWFQSLGTVLAFDWNASGLTTVLTASLKEAIRGKEKHLGIFICGGKGKTSLKTPEEIINWGERICLQDSDVKNLVYGSKTAAKVDSSLIQDGYQIYHHAFFFSRNGAWSVVQQGMNQNNSTARRYHWFSNRISDFVCEPHSGIISHLTTSCLNMTAKESQQNRKISTELVQSTYSGLMKDIQILRKHSGNVSKMIALKHQQQELVFAEFKNIEFHYHPVIEEDFSRSRYLEKILAKVCDYKPENYEKLVGIEGVGPKTIRALSLVSELIYGAPASYKDPARYSFAHGGKDGTPYPVDRYTYDNTISFFRRVISRMKASPSEKNSMLKKLERS
ncbi:MAG TPA: DUF763 domain-containing protein [Candidatus Ratteibacteria bacterium]|uniref:DUF763 domain-containing protein n=1 Tax=candidate division TA06 bacterium ADurb.Bin131 TaxID=1852827 RepID=A0A1V6C6K7_UNCT6|nr:MAG: hypothetical protein BWX89_01300 [candidate division TA06 bacterium ADurb.Bin131]HRS06816.1 DUF763 domain-containing protein [Candidatus Ratteibacteria bacterium]HRV03990.1 DUF763 domain-containing protein [Candidatus Ratteibacteria bacterium]